jgi:nucleoside-diphosphate-sugar epimerase
MSDPVVLIAGAGGVVGSAALERFLQRGTGEVIALSRRPPDVTAARPFRHVAVDLRDAGATSDALAELPPVTHLVYAALYEKPGLMAGWQERDQMDTNLAMLRNVLTPLAERGALQHVSTMQGTKAYGVHLHPVAVPARERHPRDPHENFYWLQEDHLREQGARHGFAWTVLRPQLILGGSIGTPMNMITVLGVYGAICREEGLPFGHPGGAWWTWQASDARLVAEALEWAATSPAAANEIFNVTNGEVCDWRHLWPSIAETLGLEPAGDTPRRISEWLPAHAATWDRVVARHGLRPLSLLDVVGDSHHFADFMFINDVVEPNPPTIMSDIKIRQAGFHSCMDTEASFRHWLMTLVDRGVLPAPEPVASPQGSGAAGAPA